MIQNVPGLNNYYINEDGSVVCRKLNSDLYIVRDGKLFRRRSSHNKYEQIKTPYIVIGDTIYKLIKPSINNYGYKFISVYENGKTKTKYIHRMVAKTFIGNVSNMDVHHVDYNKQNNAYKNLQITTHRKNIEDSMIQYKGEFQDSKNRYNTHVCEICKKSISYGANLCSVHASTNRSNRANVETLEHTLKEMGGNFTKVGHKFNVSRTTIARWCKHYNIPHKQSDWVV